MHKTVDVSRKRQRLAGDKCPQKNAAQIEAHKIVWEAKLQHLIEKKGNGRNAQVLTRENIAHIISMLERIDSILMLDRLRVENTIPY